MVKRTVECASVTTYSVFQYDCSSYWRSSRVQFSFCAVNAALRALRCASAHYAQLLVRLLLLGTLCCRYMITFSRALVGRTLAPGHMFPNNRKHGNSVPIPILITLNLNHITIYPSRNSTIRYDPMCYQHLLYRFPLQTDFCIAAFVHSAELLLTVLQKQL